MKRAGKTLGLVTLFVVGTIVCLVLAPVLSAVAAWDIIQEDCEL